MRENRQRSALQTVCNRRVTCANIASSVAFVRRLNRFKRAGVNRGKRVNNHSCPTLRSRFGEAEAAALALTTV